MKIKKVIEIPFGCCSESIVWEVGAKTCRKIGTYPDTNANVMLLTDTFKFGENGTLWEFILNYLGNQIK